MAEITNQQNFKTDILVGNQISRFQEKFNAKTYTFSTTKELLESQQLNSIEKSTDSAERSKFWIWENKITFRTSKHDTVFRNKSQCHSA